MLRPLGSTLYYDDWYRAATNGTQLLAHGVVYANKVCVRFDWQWLMFPAVLIVIAALLLMAVILREGARDQQRPIWKSSILPLLFYGFPDGAVVGNQEPVDAEALFATAKSLSVHLNTRTEHGSEVGWHH